MSKHKRATQPKDEVPHLRVFGSTNVEFRLDKNSPDTITLECDSLQDETNFYSAFQGGRLIGVELPTTSLELDLRNARYDGGKCKVDLQVTRVGTQDNFFFDGFVIFIHLG